MREQTFISDLILPCSNPYGKKRGQSCLSSLGTSEKKHSPSLCSAFSIWCLMVALPAQKKRNLGKLASPAERRICTWVVKEDDTLQWFKLIKYKIKENSWKVLAYLLGECVLMISSLHFLQWIWGSIVWCSWKWQGSFNYAKPAVSILYLKQESSCIHW